MKRFAPPLKVITLVDDLSAGRDVDQPIRIRQTDDSQKRGDSKRTHRVTIPALSRDVCQNVRMPTVRVTVTLKPSLLDSAGRTVAGALQKLSYDEVTGVRIGKSIELQVDRVDDDRIKEMCTKLLSNPVIEDFKYEVVG